MRPDSFHPPLAGLLAAAMCLLLACSRADSKPGSGSVARGETSDLASADTAPPAPPATRGDTLGAQPGLESKTAHLSPLADSISAYLVFSPVGDLWYLAASRNRRMFVDIGRVDTEVRRDSARAAAFRQAVQRRSPVPIGARFRLRGSFGTEEVTAAAIESWNGRIVLRLNGSPALDSVVRGTKPLIASALRIDVEGAVAGRADSVRASAPDSCDRRTPPAAEVVGRVQVIRDSLTQELQAGPQPPLARLRQKMAFASSQLTGCFGPARVLLVVALKAGNVEWVQERVVLVDTLGKVIPLRVTDFRFRAHDLLAAFDADGDGVDDIATRATTQRAGATSVLVLNLKTRRLTRLVAGFAWEDQ